MKRWGMAMLVVGLSAGCATAPNPGLDDAEASRAGQVGVRDITGLVPAGARLQLADNESFLMPLDEPDNPVPAYPATLLARKLPPQAVCLRVAIGDDGKVLSSAPLSEGEGCAAVEASHQAFVDAATAAVAGWRFEPALRCVFPTIAAKQNVEASCSGGEEVPVAVSLAYRFVFEQHDGRGSVRIGK